MPAVTRRVCFFGWERPGASRQHGRVGMRSVMLCSCVCGRHVQLYGAARWPRSGSSWACRVRMVLCGERDLGGVRAGRRHVWPVSACSAWRSIF
eukprot:7378378-Prymnesium_polylepis.1